MKRLEIQAYPAEVLKKKAKTVKKYGPELESLVERMFEIMYETGGVGLAAPQVGISKRIAVIDSRQSPNERMVLVNPSIVKREGEETIDEGCLSVPEAFAGVKRAARVEVQAQDVTGRKIHFTAEGMLARIVQHEVDHLDGQLFIDRLDVVTRERVLSECKDRKELPEDTAQQL